MTALPVGEGAAFHILQNSRTSTVILKKQKHPDDIRIDHRSWISLQSPKERRESALQIDEFVSRVPAFWNKLETECIAECCGIAAFSFWEQDLHRALEKCDMEVGEAVNSLRNFVAEHEVEMFVSARLNQFFPRDSLVELLNHINAIIAKHNGGQARSSSGG